MGNSTDDLRIRWTLRADVDPNTGLSKTGFLESHRVDQLDVNWVCEVRSSQLLGSREFATPKTVRFVLVHIYTGISS